jgi:hypothetical protein
MHHSDGGFCDGISVWWFGDELTWCNCISNIKLQIVSCFSSQLKCINTLKSTQSTVISKLQISLSFLSVVHNHIASLMSLLWTTFHFSYNALLLLAILLHSGVSVCYFLRLSYCYHGDSLRRKNSTESTATAVGCALWKASRPCDMRLQYTRWWRRRPC